VNQNPPGLDPEVFLCRSHPFLARAVFFDGFFLLTDSRAFHFHTDAFSPSNLAVKIGPTTSQGKNGFFSVFLVNRKLEPAAHACRSHCQY
jgi:hypothetical protein